MKFALFVVGAASAWAILSSSYVVGIVNSATRTAPARTGRWMRFHPMIWKPSTASTASGIVIPWNACSGVAPRLVPDSTKIANAASGQVRAAAARNVVGRREYATAAGTSKGTIAIVIDQNENACLLAT